MLLDLVVFHGKFLIPFFQTVVTMARPRADMPAPSPDAEAPGYWARDGSLPPSESDAHQSLADLDSETNFSVMALRRRGVPEDWVDYIAQYPEGRDIRHKRYLMDKYKADRRQNRSRMSQKLAELVRRRRGIPGEGPVIPEAELRGLMDEAGEPLPQ